MQRKHLTISLLAVLNGHTKSSGSLQFSDDGLNLITRAGGAVFFWREDAAGNWYEQHNAEVVGPLFFSSDTTYTIMKFAEDDDTVLIKVYTMEHELLTTLQRTVKGRLGLSVHTRSASVSDCRWRCARLYLGWGVF